MRPAAKGSAVWILKIRLGQGWATGLAPRTIFRDVTWKYTGKSRPSQVSCAPRCVCWINVMLSTNESKHGQRECTLYTDVCIDSAKSQLPICPTLCNCLLNSALENPGCRSDSLNDKVSLFYYNLFDTAFSSHLRLHARVDFQFFSKPVCWLRHNWFAIY